VNFGILGDAKIAREKVAPAIIAAGHRIVHLGRRRPDQPAQLNISADIKISSYEDMLADPEVEAVYNPLPNHLHVDWTIKALEAGKPVLCEKPLALTLDETDRLEAVCRQTKLYVYEGFMVRYHPQWQWLSQLDIGARQLIVAQFSYPPQPDGNVRNYASMGGGPVWDIGCYCLLAGRMIFGTEPKLVASLKAPEAELDVEKSAAALFDFGDGRMLSFIVSSGTALSQMLRVVGTQGWAELDVPFNPPAVTTARWAHNKDGVNTLLSPGQPISFPACDQYQLMIDDFVAACQSGRQADFTDSRMLTRHLGQIVSSG